MNLIQLCLLFWGELDVGKGDISCIILIQGQIVGDVVTKVTRGGLDFTLLSATNTRHASLLTQTYSHLLFSLPCE